MQLHEVQLDRPRVYHLPDWDRTDHRGRVAFLRKIAMHYARDPRIRSTVARILEGTNQRDYQTQAATLLKWVHANIAYYNEPGEVLQDPLYTLEHRYADCDDGAILLATFFESIRLPWRYALSGQVGARRAWWHEGLPIARGAKWGHIYLHVGWPPFRPTTWASVEPTIKGVPLGWEVGKSGPLTGVGATSTTLPELSGGLAGALAFGNPGTTMVAINTPPEDNTPWYLIDRSTLRTVFLTTLVGAVSTVISQVALTWWMRRPKG